MSSLRNAVKRVTHKERSQPTKRAHLGILEKKKDYKIRSQDYHKKQDVLSNLRTKASMKNPDEFYFGMNNAQIDGEAKRHLKTREADRREREKVIGPEAVKLMKSQDLSYVRMQTLKDMRRVEKMQSSLQMLGDNPVGKDRNNTVDKNRGKHTLFMESKEKASNFDVAEHFDTVPELAGRAFNRPRKETLVQMNKSNSSSNNNNYGNEQFEDDNEEGEGQRKVLSEKDRIKEAKIARKIANKIAKARAAGYRELDARVNRIKMLKHAESHLVTEKIVASKGRKRKIKEAEDGKPAVYKFRKKRSR